ncbi:MAG: spiro-SPASM protein [Spirochaetaceae bacterium]|nr:MAG: spiro-SPASM protein [Spirochaetaceae bacterium]
MSIISVDMKNLAVANALALNPYALEAIAGGATAMQRVREYAGRLPGVEHCLLLLPEDADMDLEDLGFDIRRVKAGGIVELLRSLQDAGSDYDNLFYFFADCPLLDSGLSARMLDNHQKYYADYTFADGYPYGLSPEILKPALLTSLLALAQGSRSSAAEEPIHAHDRGALFELIKKDINAFDIETELSPVDLRMLRAELSADCKRNLLLVQRVIQGGAETADAVCRLLKEQPEILRTLPSFFAVQIVAGCPQLCSYCPYPGFGIEVAGKQGEMELKHFIRILEQIHAFCGEATIGVSLWGEPAYHSGFADLAAAALAKNFRLVVESSGIGWQDGVFSRIAENKLPGLDWIISLDSRDPQEYKRLRGGGFEEAHKSVEVLQSLFPGHVYPQAVRMNENEEGLEDFFRYWKSQTGRVIVQKYDHFCGYLPDRRVTDLSPLKRFPCWHLKRDVTVLLDGRVSLCREDLRCEHGLGNLLEQSLEEIWTAAEPYYRDHLQERYPDLCKNCDEYYSFNF